MNRPRRLRRSTPIRDLRAETRLHPDRLIQPHFVTSHGGRQPIASLPGIERVGLQELVEDVAHDLDLGLRTILLFGVPEQAGKDLQASGATSAQALVPRAVRALKQEFGSDVTVITDVCLCAYTTHGHCGILVGDSVHNDASLQVLGEMAAAHAEAGADVVAPSDMMDGRVGHLRRVLDERGHTEAAIMSYSIKYASAYYGPFREAAGSAPATGDRRSYQMDPRNIREALREAALDTQEGADALMVKPALAYLDVIRAIRDASDLPLACYNVSGEYSMVKHAAAAGLVDEAQIVRENLTAFARAGADWIITYHAREAVREGWLP